MWYTTTTIGDIEEYCDEQYFITRKDEEDGIS